MTVLFSILWKNTENILHDFIKWFHQDSADFIFSVIRKSCKSQKSCRNSCNSTTSVWKNCLLRLHPLKWHRFPKRLKGGAILAPLFFPVNNFSGMSWFDMWYYFNTVKPRFLFKTVELWSYILPIDSSHQLQRTLTVPAEQSYPMQLSCS